MKKIIILIFTIFLITSCNPYKTKLGEEFFGGITISLSKSTLTVSNSQVASGGTVIVTLQLRDNNGAAYISSLPVVTFSISGGTSTSTFSTVTNNHDGTYSATLTGVNVGSAATLHAKINNLDLQSTLPTIEVGFFQVLESYQSSSGQDASANAVVFDSSGALWVGGFANDSSGSMHWMVRKAAGPTQSFSTSDDYQLTSTWDARVNSIAVAPDGTIWAVGDALDSNSVSHWIVRSLPLGGVWSTSEDYQRNAGYSAQASAVTVDTAGNVYVGGSATDNSGTQHWIVRKKTSGGGWAMSEDYQPAAAKDAFVTGLAYDSANDIVYASGIKWTASGKSSVVRSYASSVWGASDAFQLSAGQDSFALGIAVDSASNVYSIGFATDASAIDHWISRILPWGGSWSTLDNDTLSSGQHAYGQGIAAGSGSVYTTGFEANSSSRLDWVTREYITGQSTFNLYEDLAGATTSDIWLGSGAAMDSSQLPYTVGTHSDGTSTYWVVRGLK